MQIDLRINCCIFIHAIPYLLTGQFCRTDFRRKVLQIDIEIENFVFNTNIEEKKLALKSTFNRSKYTGTYSFRILNVHDVNNRVFLF